MEFEERLKKFIERIEKIKNTISTEEATKTSLIMPFFSILGYDVFNPNEFTPEYIADVGIKKGEKVDYAIILDSEVKILIEAKCVNENLKKHSSQLFRYFGTSNAKLAILTNGVIYKFFTDLDETNKMDTTPFLEVNLLDINENTIVELKKFCKENFNTENIINTATDLKYSNSIEKVLNEEFSNPSDDFIKFILNKGVYDGVKTQNVIDKYRSILKKSLVSFINDFVNKRLQNALNTSPSEEKNDEKPLDESSNNDGIVTTMEELEGYYTVKSILTEKVMPESIFYKDTYSYFSILYDNKVTKWICRIYIKDSCKYIIIPDDNKQEIRYDIEKMSDIYKLKDKLFERLNTFLK